MPSHQMQQRQTQQPQSPTQHHMGPAGATTEGGRFDFNDGGCYIGEWAEGRAHGLGIATGPEDNPGEYAGEWILGFESLGVYIWMSGSIYEGRWMKGKRHGEGVQAQGRWRYQGEFTTGFCGRYGVRESLNSCAKYEGSWNLNQFDGFGIETNSDGSTYAGAWTKGLRSGLGVRKSVAYDKASELTSSSHIRANSSQSSLPLGANEPDIAPGPRDAAMTSDHAGRHNDGHKNGFVLVGEASAHMSVHHKKGFLEKSGLSKLNIFKKLRKQKSTGDLKNAPSHANFPGSGRGGGSLRSTLSTTSQMTSTSMPAHGQYLDVHGPHLTPGPISLGTSNTLPSSSAGSHNHILAEFPIHPDVTETYMGQWAEDRRTGYGVAERSDGLRYEGEWLNNKKNGYGCTYFPDGSKEEGRYRNNQLVSSLNRKNKLMLLRGSRMRDAVDAAVAKAQQMSKDALTKSQESAIQRSQTARMAATSAINAAKEARRACELARTVAHEFSPDFVQQGPLWEAARESGQVVSFGDGSKLNRSTRQANKSSQQQQQRSPTHLTANENDAGNSGECLEISGGSRRGSFRSSFRRNRMDGSGGAAGSQDPNQPASTGGKTVTMAPSTANNSRFQRPTGREQSPSPNAQGNLLVPHANLQPNNTSTPNNNQAFQRKTLARQTASPQDHQTPQSQFHPNSPHDPQHHGNIMQGRHPVVEETVVKRDHQSTQAAAAPSHQGHHNAESPPSSQLRPRKLPPPSSSMSLSRSPARSSRIPNHRGQSDHSSYGNSESPFRWGLTPHLTDSRLPNLDDLERFHSTTRRRRSEPCVMSTKPVLASVLPPAVAARSITSSPRRGVGAVPFGRASWCMDAEHATFVIDRGVQKRIMVERASQTRRQKHDHGKFSLHMEADELAPLPRHYTFVYQTPLRKDLGHGSMLDVSVCEEKRRRGGMWTHEELTIMCQAQRQKQLLLEERRRRGEIIIRLADLKDWMRGNVWVLLLCLLNALLAVAFLYLIKDAQIIPSNPSAPSRQR